MIENFDFISPGFRDSIETKSLVSFISFNQTITSPPLGDSVAPQ